MYDINDNHVQDRMPATDRFWCQSKSETVLVKSKTVPLEGIVGNLRNAENQP